MIIRPLIQVILRRKLKIEKNFVRTKFFEKCAKPNDNKDVAIFILFSQAKSREPPLARNTARVPRGGE